MATPLVAGLGVAAAAFVGRQLVQTYIKLKASPSVFTSVGKQYYKGGFLPEMTKREASLILGVRESAGEERIKDAHRRIMVANHPDSGGSSYIAAKVNEAKDMMLGKKKTGRSPF
ncbi:Mitochondrial import inner membrane translocase subunit TIM14 [Tetrabaena socialis]|uniref:Mitochondrial import inner membrane translocase subunit TIM14 n=1 Tax=Tetrabaena socialis TaxID=47790 RepID=A0A2J8AA28_9CHLO|nr:Mitochondrial import inner membrane translocase subunit TIM14 [Tetrabaena socialis]|eukprot:PNH09369.1 Mitochondrial import inner membrane translocase subunit TIM14 [Tetrabaena socialis]